MMKYSIPAFALMLMYTQAGGATTFSFTCGCYSTSIQTLNGCLLISPDGVSSLQTYSNDVIYRNNRRVSLSIVNGTDCLISINATEQKDNGIWECRLALQNKN